MAVAVTPDPGAKPLRARPTCCSQCVAEWEAAATAAHGTMARADWAGCTCQKCRLWAWRFNRALAGEADNEHAQRFQPHSRDIFEPEAASDPQPTQASGAGTSAGNLLRRLWQRR